MPSFFSLRAAHATPLFCILFCAALLFPLQTQALVLNCTIVDGTSVDDFHDEESGIDTLKSIQLSELYPTPLSSEEEFIELYNPNTQAVSLAGFSLSDASGKTYTFDDAQIEAEESLALLYSETKIQLNNTGDSVLLKNADGEILDATTYGAATTGMSWSRTAESAWEWTSIPSANLPNMFLTSSSADTNKEDTTETLSQESTQAQTSTTDAFTLANASHGIRLNELLPNPAGADTGAEWIELRNPSSQTLRLDGWVLTDGSTRYRFKETTIAGNGGYLLLPSSTTKISLNNTEENLQLLDAADALADSVSYTKAPEGESYARFAGRWQWTETLTPGAANALSANGTQKLDTQSKAVGGNDNGALALQSSATHKKISSMQTPALSSIADAREAEDGTRVSTEGVINVAPGIFGTQYFYIQDGGAGIQIFSSKSAFPEDLAVGMTVRITGERSTANGTARVKITEASQVVVVNRALKILEPIDLGDEPLAESHEGMLVTTSGILAEKRNSVWELDSGIVLSLKKSVGIVSADYKKESPLNVIGIVEEYRGEYRIVPRSTDDLQKAIISIDAAISASDTKQGTAATHTQDSPQSPQTYGNISEIAQTSKRRWILFGGTALLALALSIAALLRKQLLSWSIQKLQSLDAAMNPSSTPRHLSNAASQAHDNNTDEHESLFMQLLNTPKPATLPQKPHTALHGFRDSILE